MTCRSVAFYGPYWPLFGGESTQEVGGSYYLPSIALGIARALSAIFLIVAGVFALRGGYLNRTFLARYVVLNTGISFAFVSLISLQATFGRPHSASPARYIAVIHFIACSLVILMLLSFVEGFYLQSSAVFDSGNNPNKAWNFYYRYFVQYIAPALATFIDIALGARLKFRLVYMPLPQLVLVIHTILVSARVEGHRSHHSLRHLRLLFAWFILISLSRCCRNHMSAREQEEGLGDEIESQA